MPFLLRDIEYSHVVEDRLATNDNKYFQSIYSTNKNCFELHLKVESDTLRELLS